MMCERQGSFITLGGNKPRGCIYTDRGAHRGQEAFSNEPVEEPGRDAHPTSRHAPLTQSMGTKQRLYSTADGSQVCG